MALIQTEKNKTSDKVNLEKAKKEHQEKVSKLLLQFTYEKGCTLNDSNMAGFGNSTLLPLIMVDVLKTYGENIRLEGLDLNSIDWLNFQYMSNVEKQKLCWMLGIPKTSDLAKIITEATKKVVAICNENQSRATELDKRTEEIKSKIRCREAYDSVVIDD